MKAWGANDEFELSLGREDGRWLVHATSPLGERDAPFEMPFTEEGIENFVLRMTAPRRGVLGLESVSEHRAQQFGRDLFDALFAGEVHELYRKCRKRATEVEHALRVTLHVDHDPVLAGVPWEYLYDHHDFTALSARTPVVRRVGPTTYRRPPGFKPPLRVLGMVSSPPDQEALDVDAERSRLEASLGDLAAEGLVEIEWCERASLLELHRRIEARPVHAFHYVGHGVWDAGADDGVLLFDNGVSGQPITGRQLGRILGDSGDLRLAVLTACQGGRSSRADPLAGVAAGLVNCGLPAVVAMQSDITATAAATFTEDFYGALARGSGVDTAVTKGRRAIYAQGNEVEWATPVLFLEVNEGRIFDVWSPTLDPGVEALLDRMEARPGSTKGFRAEEVVVDAEVRVVKVVGDLDLFTGPELTQLVEPALADGVRFLVLDLSETEYLSSSGLHFFMEWHKKLRARDGELLIASADDNVTKTFVLTGLDLVLATFPSVPAALQAVGR